MTEEIRKLVILRLSGEVTTKASQTRKRFNRQLVHNVANALKRGGVEDFRIDEQWHRIDVHTDDERAAKLLARVPGLQWVTPATAFRWESIDDIVEIGFGQAKERVAGKTFGVRTRRVGQRNKFPFKSNDVDRALGARLGELAAGVDLDAPEVRVGVEVREDGEFYLYSEELAGPGGLPLGVEGRALALVSGGFDSVVAAYLMAKRGVALDFLFFNLAGAQHEQAVREVSHTFATLYANGYEPRLHVVDFRPVVADMKKHVQGRYWQLLLKRLMMRAGALLAREEGYQALVTGESVGQVSSQTLSNLHAITVGIDCPILRPLLGFNKEEITQLAQKIGTYEASAGNPEFCSLEGGKPVTNGKPRELDAQEAKVTTDLASLVSRRRILDALEAPELPEVEIRLDHVPEGAVVVDLRPPDEYERWAYPDAMNLPFEKAMENFALLPKDRTWFFYCDVGLKSATLADFMRAAGFEAFAYEGGLQRLKRYVARSSA